VQIAEEIVLNVDDIESLCALPPGTLQNKIVAFPQLSRTAR
jgi:hypothetical protein